MRNIWLIALVALASVSKALVLDDFTDGNVDSTISAGSADTFTAASVPGGFRYIGHTIEANPLNLTHNVTVVNGVLAFSSKTSVDAVQSIGWGVDNVGVPGANDLNANLASFDRFRLNVLSNDIGTTAVLFVRSSGVNAGNFISSGSFNIPGNASLTNQSFDILFSNFAGMDFTDVDSIFLTINTPASGDLVLDSFEAVPEPTTMAILAGAAFFASRRRKK